MNGKAAAGLLLALAAQPAFAACPFDLKRGAGWVVFSGDYIIAFQPEDGRIEVGEAFSLLVNVCTRSDKAAELVAVTAEVSESGHTMSAKPRIVAGQNGRNRVEGLLFDVAGQWEIDFDVRSGGDVERLTHDVIVR
jgi:hypothetical protein